MAGSKGLPPSTSSARGGLARLPIKLYYRIGEVAELVGVETHVLRYWESEFSSIRPQKSPKGQRVYSRKDLERLLVVKELLYTQGYTVAGAKKRLREVGRNEAERLAILAEAPEPALAQKSKEPASRPLSPERTPTTTVSAPTTSARVNPPTLIAPESPGRAAPPSALATANSQPGPSEAGWAGRAERFADLDTAARSGATERAKRRPLGLGDSLLESPPGPSLKELEMEAALLALRGEALAELERLSSRS